MSALPAPLRWILGSRSPRRHDLLRHVLPGVEIEVRAPSTAAEAGFDGLTDWPAIRQRLSEIVRAKSDDVIAQVQRETTRAGTDVVITADTTIVAGETDGRLTVLGQPPDGDHWGDVVRGWFREHYFGRTHTVATAIRVDIAGGETRERIVTTRVEFRADGERWLDWYINTGEPRGKAGGYAIQGAADIFVDRVDGSVSNVVGLPLGALLEMLAELAILRSHKLPACAS